MILWSAVALAGFRVELTEGLDPERGVLEEGHAVRDNVRQLPGTEDPTTVRVQVPETWVRRDADGLEASEALDASAVQHAEILRALNTAKLPGAGADPVERAGTVTVLLQNAAFESARPSERGAGVVEPWLLLYDPEAGDTLSAGVHALALTAAIDLDTQLARYACPNSPSGACYGLTLSGTAPQDAGWARDLGGGRVLLLMHPAAEPASDPQLESWTLSEVSAGAIGGEAVVLPDPPPKPDTPEAPRPPRAPLIHQENLPWWLGSGILTLAMVVFAGWSIRQRAQARAVGEKRRERKESQDF